MVHDHAQTLINFINNTKLDPVMILTLMRDLVNKRQMEQFNQVFQDTPTDELESYIKALQQIIEPPKKVTKKRGKKVAVRVSKS